VDECDRGARASAQYLRAALLDRERRRWPDPGGDECAGHDGECEDCGEEIPEERRMVMTRLGMACTRCVDCQTKFERGI
jgi:RNA polymerase-binding transcription factor DksA